MNLEAYERFKDISNVLTLMPGPRWFKPGHYVYVLMFDGAFQYVGCSGRLRGRIMDHIRWAKHDPEFQFNKILARGFDNAFEALRKESELIAKLKPPFNGVRPSRPRYDPARIARIREEECV